MPEVEVLICKRLGAIDACRPCTVTVEKVAALTHEVGDLMWCLASPVSHAAFIYQTKNGQRWTHDAVEARSFVTLWPTQVVLGLARAKLPEVLCRLGNYILVQLKGDAAERLACRTVSRYKSKKT